MGIEKEYTFDLTLTGMARVKAVGFQEAKRLLREFIPDCEMRAVTDKIEFHLGNIEGELDLVEINGEAI